MAEERPSIQIDTDWKKQAQEDKKRLAEQEATRKAAPTGPAGVVPNATAAKPPASAVPTKEAPPMPPATFDTLIQSLVTQTLFYLGEVATRSGQQMMDLDMARHHLDTLAMLEEKTANNLTPEEKMALDGAIYETRMRFINAAQQQIPLP